LQFYFLWSEKGIEMLSIITKVLLMLALNFFILGGTNGNAADIVANHQSANDFTSIPESYFNQVRSFFEIYYGHTSHGSQVITGLSMLNNEYSVMYAPPSIYDDYRIDLGDPAWESETRSYFYGEWLHWRKKKRTKKGPNSPTPPG
jgi:hypothetical protein